MASEDVRGNIYVSIEECIIFRNLPEFPDKAVLMRGYDNHVIFTVSDSWTDAQIWEALRFANKMYGMGFRVGCSVTLSNPRKDVLD